MRDRRLYSRRKVLGRTLLDPALYLNRELTWLAFNSRVLHEAEDERTPLLERVKFLAITASNLDEFFMKRIGGLKQQLEAGVQKVTVDGLTPVPADRGVPRRRAQPARCKEQNAISGHLINIEMDYSILYI